MNYNHIGFSHNYTKLHGQTSGVLLYVSPFVIDDNFPKETYEYDTDNVFELKNGKYLQLVFLGNKMIPFTTYRDDDEIHRKRFYGHENEEFTFNFASSCRNKSV